MSNKKDRLFLSFECNICKTRTNKFISKHAYEKGMVICQCEKCKNRHLIADHLGWFDSMKQPKGNLEQIAKEHGISFRKISMEDIKDEETKWLLNGLEEYVEK
jgi:protein import protein ZIM17